jgi:peptidoglycan/LPS O-acetylase OafA/YrhL
VIWKGAGITPALFISRIKEMSTKIKEKETIEIQDDGRQPFLDVLKGCCILFVVITHFSWTKAERLRYLFPFWIGMAVPVFLLISGYVYTLSYQRAGVCTLAQAYRGKQLKKKLWRYTKPFALAFLLELGVYAALGRHPQWFTGPLSVVITFFTGGKGAGSYYYPILLQMVFVFPLIYVVIRRYAEKGLLFWGLVNFAYEVLQRTAGMSLRVYRLLLFRYLLLLAAGCYLAIYKQWRGRKVIPYLTCAAGIAFIVAFCYLDYQPRIIIYWTKTSFVACLYIIPVALELMRRFPRCSFPPLELLGKASYHIFLIQMIWYHFFSEQVGTALASRPLHLLVNMVVCVMGGLIFYFLESRDWHH